jgi:hypothetical protein
MSRVNGATNGLSIGPFAGYNLFFVFVNILLLFTDYVGSDTHIHIHIVTYISMIFWIKLKLKMTISSTATTALYCNQLYCTPYLYYYLSVYRRCPHWPVMHGFAGSASRPPAALLSIDVVFPTRCARLPSPARPSHAPSALRPPQKPRRPLPSMVESSIRKLCLRQVALPSVSPQSSPPRDRAPPSCHRARNPLHLHPSISRTPCPRLPRPRDTLASKPRPLLTRFPPPLRSLPMPPSARLWHPMLVSSSLAGSSTPTLTTASHDDLEGARCVTPVSSPEPT